MTDYMNLSAQDFSALEEHQLQEALQQITGHLAVAQAIMREHSTGHYKYLEAKERFGYLKSTASTLQTLLRSLVV